MWTAEFKIRHEGCWIIPKTEKYDVEEHGYPLTYYEKDGDEYHIGVSYFHGTDVEKVFKALERDTKIVKLERRGRQAFLLIKARDHITKYFDNEMFFLGPVSTIDGYEYWRLGSWSKKTLMAFYENVKTIGEIELLKLKRETPRVMLQHTMADLTEKQRVALVTAHEMGYFEVPRKVSVQEIAKRMNVPRTTLESHLKKAISKVMKVMIHPFM